MEKRELGDGFYFSYDQERNGYGGYHPVNMFFNNDELNIHKRITDASGCFVNFPGIVEGNWREYLKYPFREQMNFSFSINYFKDGLMEFFWVFQPDGMYYMDEDGYGMEDDIEIVFKSYINKNGDFVKPFKLSK